MVALTTKSNIRRFKAALKQLPQVVWLICFLRQLFSSIVHGNSHQSLYALTCRDVANTLLTLGKTDEAITYYHQSITYQPDCLDPYDRIAHIYENQGKIQDCVKIYLQAIRHQPQWLEAHHRIAAVIASHYNRAGECTTSYLQAISTNPNYLPVYETVAKILFSAGKLEKSIEIYRQYLQFSQQQPSVNQVNESGLRFIHHDILYAIGCIGHLDGYLKADLLWRPQQLRPILLALPEKVPNWHYLSYWQQYIIIISDPWLVEYLTPLESQLADHPEWMIQGETTVAIAHTTIGRAQQQWDAEQRLPLLTLTEVDRIRGWDCLNTLGIPREAWFVCLHVREGGFKEGGSNTENTRNAHVTSYLEAIQSIVDQGGWVFRMGDPSMQPLPSLPQVIDYALSPLKSDWMDVFLCSSCRFFIGTSSGLYKVAISFGIPCLHTNYLPLHSIAFPKQDIYLPKLLWSVAEDRHLSFEESLASPFRECYSPYQYEALGVVPTDNKSDELTGAVIEMMERLSNNFSYTEQDDLLQEHFTTLVQKYDTFHTNSRVGRDFLRKYAYLLPENKSVIN